MIAARDPHDLLSGPVVISLPREEFHNSSDHSPVPVLADPFWLALRILQDRDRRRALFPDVRFGEPSWDMMLDLFVADHQDRRFGVSDMCVAANVPTTTALNHLKRLVAHGYMLRVPDRTDRRRTFVLATDKLRIAMRGWLSLHRTWPHLVGPDHVEIAGHHPAGLADGSAEKGKRWDVRP